MPRTTVILPASHAEPAKPAEPPEPPRGGAGGSALELIGAATGAAAVLYVLGGAVLAARFHALGLPIESTVAMTPTATLIVVAFKTVGLGLLLGAALLALLEWRRHAHGPGMWSRAVGWVRRGMATALSGSPRSRRPAGPVRRGAHAIAAVPTRRKEALAASLLLIIGTVVYPVILTPLNWYQRAGIGLAGLVAIVAAVRIFEVPGTWRKRAYWLFCLVAVLAGGLRLFTEYLPPTSLDYARLNMKNGDIVGGYLIGDTKDTVIVASNVAERTFGLVTAVPRNDVLKVSISSNDDDVRPLGVDLQRSLLGKVSNAEATTDDKERRDAELQYLADVRRDATWMYPPALPREVADYLTENFDEFDNRFHPFDTDGAHVLLDDVMRDPSFYLARMLVTRGRVLYALTVERTDASNETDEFMVFGGNVENQQSYCSVRRRGAAPSFRAGDIVELSGAVTAWGTFVTGGGKPVKQLALTCSAARLIEASAPPAAKRARR